MPDDFSKNFVEQRLRMHVTQALSEQLGREVRLAVTVDPDLADSEPLPPTQGLAEPMPGPVEEPTGRPRPQGLSSTLPVDGRDDGLVDEDPEPAPPSRRGRPEPEQVELTRLNPKYTFDTFVIGSSNRFANAAAVAVAEAPAREMGGAWGKVEVGPLGWGAVTALFGDEGDADVLVSDAARVLSGATLDAAWDHPAHEALLADADLLWHGPDEWVSLVGDA